MSINELLGKVQELKNQYDLKGNELVLVQDRYYDVENILFLILDVGIDEEKNILLKLS